MRSAFKISLIAISAVTLLLSSSVPSHAAPSGSNLVWTHPRGALPASGVPVPGKAQPVNYDEQLGTTFTQDFTSLAYNVTAVAQTDSDGYGPAYLLNGLSSASYWYQVGLSYDWPFLSGGHVFGFAMNYEVFNPSGTSVFPSSGGSGVATFSGSVNPSDSVLLALSFSGGNVIMYAKDWNTGASVTQSYSAQSATSFTGSPSRISNTKGFFTGLMTEKYYVSPFYGNTQEVDYVDTSFALSSAWMWIDEFNANTSAVLFSSSTPNPVSYANPNKLQSFSSNGATEYSNAHQFITGVLRPTTLTLSYSVQGGGAGYSPPTLTYSSGSAQLTATLGTSPSTFNISIGSSWSVNSVLVGSSSLERWDTNQQGAAVASSPQTITFVYYHQFFDSFSYSVAGGGAGYSAPTLSYSQFGGPLTSNVPVGIWADAASTYTFQGQLLGSTTSERWYAPAAVGTISGSGSIPVTYNHQYLLTVVGPGSASQWYNSGSTGVFATPGVFGRQGGMGSKIVSYSLDGGAPTSVAPTAGSVTVAVIMGVPHTLVFNSIVQFQVALDPGALQALNSITPPTIPGDNYWYDIGSSARLTLNGIWNRGTNTGERLVSYALNGIQNRVAIVGTIQIFSIGSLTTPQFVSATVTAQYLLNTPSGSLVLLSTSPFKGNDSWFDSGTTVNATYNYASDVVPGQSRTNAIGYVIDQGSQSSLVRSATGTFTVKVTMNGPHILNVASVTQYFLGVSGGNNVSSTASPTRDGFYDVGTSLDATTDYTWNVVNGNTRQNLVSYTLDNVAQNVTRAEDGTFTTPTITMDKSHSLAFAPVTQYFTIFRFTDNSGTHTIVPTGFRIGLGTKVQAVPTFSLWLDNGTRFGLSAVNWEGADVKPSSPTTYDIGAPSNITVRARVYDATIKAADFFGLGISGAHLAVTFANGSSISGTTGADGTFHIGLIPIGTYQGTVTNLGVSSPFSADASVQSKNTATSTLSYPTLAALIAALGIAPAATIIQLRKRRHPADNKT
jgi:hypothetical protein